MLSWIVTSCALILAVMLLRRIFRGKASARAIYALWLFVALRLLIPGSVAVDSPVPTAEQVISRAPVVQLSGALSEAEHVEYTGSGTVEAQFTPDSSPVTVAENVTQREFDLAGLLVRIEKLLPAIYIAGAAAVALVFTASWVKFSRQVRRGRRELDVVGTPVSVYVSDGVDTPCLFGFIRPAVYMPSSVAADNTLLRHALTHELTHYRQHDHIWCVVRCACLALHWYDPLVWYAARLSKRDCELACDEATVSRLGEAERANYGRSLIDLTTSSARGAAVATSMCAGAGELKDRIKMLTRRKHSVIALVLAALLTVTATACSFVGGNDGEGKPGSVSLDSGIGSMNIYDFTAPEDTGSVVLTAWYFDGSEWVQHKSWSTPCSASEGRIGVEIYDGVLSLTTQIAGASQTNPDDYSLSDVTGEIGTTWVGTSFLTQTTEVWLETPLPLAMSSGSRDGEKYTYAREMEFFDHPELIDDPNKVYVCITVTFADDLGQLTLSAQDTPNECTFDFKVPSDMQRICVDYYRYNGNIWELRDSQDFACTTDYGTLRLGWEDKLTREVIDSNDESYSVNSRSLDDIAMTDGLKWSAAVNELDGEKIAGLEEVPLIVFCGSSPDSDSGTADIGYFEDPNSIKDKDCAYVAVTVMFVYGYSTDPGPIMTQDPQAAVPESIVPWSQASEIVGFRSSYAEGESDEQAANAWVQSYADNLVYGLPSTDGASCTSVEVQSCKLSAASLTEPKHLVVLMNLHCTPRDANAFGIVFGNAAYAEPRPENSDEPCDAFLGTAVVLRVENGTTECISAATDMPDMWGFQSFEEYDDPDYIANFADAGMSAERIVSLVNYGKLNEASSKSKHALHKALSEVSIAPDGADDQLIRDMYAMLAVRYADGAYSVWLGNIYREQREHDPEAFSAALAAFDPETQEHITYLADTPL